MLALVVITEVSVLDASVMVTVAVDVCAVGVLDIGEVSGSEKLGRPDKESLLSMPSPAMCMCPWRTGIESFPAVMFGGAKVGLWC
jgi:hypothetical protein